MIYTFTVLFILALALAWKASGGTIPVKVWSINGKGKTALIAQLGPVFDRTVLSSDFVITNYVGFTKTVMQTETATSTSYRLILLWLWLDFIRVR